MKKALILFKYYWHDIAPLIIEVFAESRKEANALIKPGVHEMNLRLSGKYGPRRVDTFPVRKGLL